MEIVENMYSSIFTICIIFLLCHKFVSTTEYITTSVTTLPGPYKRNDLKIVGGKKANIIDFPYIATLKYLSMHICGASIITNKHMITAAHCIEAFKNYEQGYLKLFSVAVGSHFNTRGLPYKIKYIIVHPNYGTNFIHDIAIIVVENRFKWSRLVQPIFVGNKEIPENSTCVIIGWGNTKQVIVEKVDNQRKKRHTPRQLLKTTVRTLNDNICYTITIKQAEKLRCWLCAYEKEQDTCQGDSGGPLIFKGQLVGITSFGIGCAMPGQPGVYTNVSNYYEWIWSTVANYSTAPKPIYPNKIAILNCVFFIIILYLYLLNSS